MAEASNGRVTITLGRTGQVVNRAATSSDVNRKRSIRDRLGSNSDSFSSRGGVLNNKRQRGDDYFGSLNEDARIDQHDLRYKLMQKNASRRAHSNHDMEDMDLRQKLSRTVEQPGRPYSTTNTRQSVPDSRSAIPLTRSADNLPRMDSSGKSYSPWTLDHIRRSPDRVIGRTRGLSPPRNTEDLPRRPLSRTFDDPRTLSLMNKDVLDASRPSCHSTAYMAKPMMPSVSVKPVAPLLGQLPRPSAIMLKSSHAGEDHQTVEGLLHSLGLGKYAILFKAEEVDMTALKQMGERDLKELGIPMGPRKKILLALLPRAKRQP